MSGRQLLVQRKNTKWGYSILNVATTINSTHMTLGIPILA